MSECSLCEIVMKFSFLWLYNELWKSYDFFIVCNIVYIFSVFEIIKISIFFFNNSNKGLGAPLQVRMWIQINFGPNA